MYAAASTALTTNETTIECAYVRCHSTNALGPTSALKTSIFAMLPATTITAHARHGARGTNARAMTSDARPCVPTSIGFIFDSGDSANLLCSAVLGNQ